MSVEQRVLILAPFGRDADVIAEVLAQDGRECSRCAHLDMLVDELEQGAGTAMIAEEALPAAQASRLFEWLDRQEAWSDFPVTLLASKRGAERSKHGMEVLERLGNVVVLERPLNSETLRRAVSSSLRARIRQYDSRRHLQERIEAQTALLHLNDSLEGRIAERTHELASANNRLMTEIHERAKVQAVLVQSQKMEALGQLTGGIAHDFNNLLNIIMVNAELIARAGADDRIRKMADTVKRATERGAKLTGQLLTFSRNSNLDMKSVDVVALLRNMRDIITVSLGSGIQYGFKHERKSMWTETDANQLELAILNLAINARDAMPDGGQLTVRASERGSPDTTLDPGRYVVIEVIDTGSGIPPDVMSRVFDPFFTTKPVGKGTGLGLSQVYGIARQAGGAARIFSEPEKGTTVEVWLPLRAAVEPEAPAETSVESGTEHARRVLVVEDDRDVRAMLVESLRLLGYSVTEAPDGESGLSRLKNDNPDLLMVDFAMPGMNGIDVITEARKMRADLPVILATGYADVDISELAVKRCTILRKPFQLDDLARTVRQGFTA